MITAAGLDVGITTGMAVTEIGKGIISRVKHTDNIVYTDQNELARLVRTFSIYSVEIVIVEFPLVDPHSTTFKEIQKVLATWGAALAVIEDVIPIVHVKPSEWKTTHAKLHDLTDLLPPGHYSRHVKDAARMLYWYSVFKYGK